MHACIAYAVSQLCCARILLSVLRTLLHGAFPWLQPRSPVVQEVVESGPGPPDASAEERGSVRAEEVRASRRVANRRRGGKAHGNPQRGSQADAREADAKAAAVRARGAVSVHVVGRSLPWLA